MKGLVFIIIIAGILTVWYLSTKTKETFVSEFTDKTNDERTFETSTSSYAQQTNHVIPTRPQLEEVPGMETPFRVNMYNSFQTA
jgi:hypothetical protein